MLNAIKFSLTNWEKNALLHMYKMFLFFFEDYFRNKRRLTILDRHISPNSPGFVYVKQQKQDVNYNQSQLSLLAALSSPNVTLLLDCPCLWGNNDEGESDIVGH